MKRLIVGVAFKLLLLGAALAAQQPEATSAKTPEAAAIRAEAENSSRAFMNGDFRKVLDLTYPRLIEMGGGREKMLAAVEDQLKEMRDLGMKIISHRVGEPQPSVRAGDKLVAIVPTVLRMESPEYVFEQNSFWLAVSNDEGKSWRFIDGSSLDAHLLKLLLPEAVGKLKLPAVTQPLMERKPATPKAEGVTRQEIPATKNS